MGIGLWGSLDLGFAGLRFCVSRFHVELAFVGPKISGGLKSVLCGSGVAVEGDWLFRGVCGWCVMAREGDLRKGVQ